MDYEGLERELGIVGAGPAGLCAAIEAAKLGVKVMVVDENSSAGGQLFKQIHKFFGSQEHKAGKRGISIGWELLKEAENVGVEIMLNTVAWGIFQEKREDSEKERVKILALLHRDKICYLRSSKVILATGATENAIAFPGWTLPGVMGAGAAQTMVNIHRVLPGKEVLMIGSGNVGLIVSYQLLQAGAEVKAVIDMAPTIKGYGVHASKLRRYGVPILTSHTIKEALGKEYVEGAVIVQVDERMKPISNTEKILKVDTICLAVGLSPMSELARLADCEFAYSSVLGGHVPIHDDNMETSQKGIYVAGDLTGIEEASTAMEEGRLAGLAAAHSLGYMKEEEFREAKQKIWKRLNDLRQGTFGEEIRRAKDSLIQKRSNAS